MAWQPQRIQLLIFFKDKLLKDKLFENSFSRISYGRVIDDSALACG